ncbi:N-acetyltransferase Eis [Methylobacterium cerastii]|uniref:N-acetyltransferase Eis n=1 Tax=Methylobacterium cerastii TaxID=932741 RepID=A0ABQ4QBX1_9HYPH|nr:N-acetyltransferase [Methylobacterium cerastii]GJD42199.1 N-acetyltransferase Eis [Methylobacterium cerastii]
MQALSLVIRPETPDDHHAIERLHARAFGPGRYARTAFRLREGATHRADLSVTASVGSFLVGSVRMAPVTAGGGGFLALGPLAVDPSFSGRGVGTSLMRASLTAAAEAGESLVILVGDAPFYARFGFRPVPAGQLVLPGPVDPARFLALELKPDFLATAQGPVAADRRS